MSELLRKVITSTGNQNLPDGAGLLNEKQTAFFKAATGIDGKIAVYREFKPMSDTIEYTVFFRRDGVKYRLDLVELGVVFEHLDEVAAEWYMVGRTVEAIKQEAYEEASKK